MVRPALRALAATAIFVSLTACGGGGGGSDPVGAGASLTITTATVPGGTTAAPYQTTQLEAVGADGAVTWDVAAGALPTGLHLSPAGLLSGSPTANGAFDFTARAADDVTVTTRAYSILIGDLVLSVEGGLQFGDAWSEAPLALTTTGSAGDVTFVVLDNASGGTLSDLDAQAGTAVWTPGTAANVTDVLQATDTASNETSDLQLEIKTNPTVNHVAGFGTNDVWWIDVDEKRGNHAYASDVHKGLADVGLWPPTSTGPTSTELEQLIEVLFRVQLLRELNQIYLRNADGSPGVDGLSISFPFEEPGASFQTPSPGNTLSGSATRYSVMEIADADGQPSGVLGVAFLDPTNNSHEHDGGSSLGVFIDAVTGSFDDWQRRNFLVGNPVGDDDREVLEALLYDTPMSGTRYDDIKLLLEYYCRAIAIVTAHEIGHSVGLDHNGESGTLLAAAVGFSTQALSTSNAVPLTSGEITQLETELPGPGKTAAPLTLFGAESEQPGREVRSALRRETKAARHGR